MWDSFGRRKTAKAANDGSAAGEPAPKTDGEDMFTRAGVAAE